jgi:glycosyltransferase involved in cell wall biosynthesis
VKILIISTSDNRGGAARAAYRLHHALLSENIDSKMIVQEKETSDQLILGPITKMQRIISKFRFRTILDRVPVLLYINKENALFSPSWAPFGGIIERINKERPDIVHLHWVAGGMISIEDIGKIKAPIVWNLQDMWTFTGGCHFDDGCGLYQSGCGNCKVLNSRKKHDLSQNTFKRKQKAFSKIKNMSIVGVSRWVTDCAKKSSLLKDREIVNLPNCFDTNLFKPIEKNIAKEMFGIPKNKKVILFGAMNSLGDPRKGAKELFEALSQLEVENAIFVIAGSKKPKKNLRLKYPVYFIPPLKSELDLPAMYNVADVMLVPSLQENLANSIIESLSCGVPVVAFDIDGNSDMIEHQKNGYLAKKLDTADMARGIEWILNVGKYCELSISARQKVLNEFDSRIVSKKYIKLYKNVINRNKSVS